MNKQVEDQHSGLAVSRQRKWQLRQKQKGLCEKCSKPAAPESVYCIGHMADHRVTARRNYMPEHESTRPYCRTKSHRLAAAAEGDMRLLWPCDVEKLLASRWPEHRDLAQRALRERPELAPKDISWIISQHRALLNQSQRHRQWKGID